MVARSWPEEREADGMGTRIRHHGDRVRIEENGCVLCELPRFPGPTHSVWDVLACAVRLFAPGSRMAMLGFAGGGMVGAMRAIGCEQEVEGVDLWVEGFEVFREVAADWSGAVRFHPEDAVAWMRRQRTLFDVIVEDLSVPLEGDVVKPEVSWVDLPPLMGRKLKKSGVVISNLLPTPGISWENLIAASRVGPGVVVEFESYYNRVLIQGSDVGGARSCGYRLRKLMCLLGSDLTDDIRLRTLQDAH